MSSSLFQFDKKLTKTVDQLQLSMGLPSRAAVIHHAVALLKFAQEANDNGKEIIIKAKNKEYLIKITQ